MTATRSNGGEGQAPPSPSFSEEIHKFFSSVSLTIFLLSFIAVASIFGTLIRQQASPQEYLSVYSESTYAILSFLSLDDIFHSWWFMLAIGLLVLNLVLCSWPRFTKLMKAQSVPKVPDRKTLDGMSLRFTVQGKNLDDVSGMLRGYKAVYNGEDGRVLERGSLGRYGFYMVHLSIVLILVGGLIGLLFGFRGPLILNKGETKDTFMVRGSAVRNQPMGFSLKLNQFTLALYPTGEPKDFASDVEVIEDGKTVLRKTIRVNDPLNYKGIHVYQASYGSNPVFQFDVGGDKVELGQGSMYKKGSLQLLLVRYEKSVHNFGPGVQVTYLQDGEPQTAWFLRDVPKLRERTIMGIPVRLENINDEFYTGLEVAYDPGVWVVWTGFALILFGLYVNFFVYYRRIYLVHVSDGVLVAGVAFKNREGFKEEFEKLKGKLGCS